MLPVQAVLAVRLPWRRLLLITARLPPPSMLTIGQGPSGRKSPTCETTQRIALAQERGKRRCQPSGQQSDDEQWPAVPNTPGLRGFFGIVGSQDGELEELHSAAPHPRSRQQCRVWAQRRLLFLLFCPPETLSTAGPHSGPWALSLRPFSAPAKWAAIRLSANLPRFTASLGEAARGRGRPGGHSDARRSDGGSGRPLRVWAGRGTLAIEDGPDPSGRVSFFRQTREAPHTPGTSRYKAVRYGAVWIHP